MKMNSFLSRMTILPSPQGRCLKVRSARINYLHSHTARLVWPDGNACGRTCGASPHHVEGR